MTTPRSGSRSREPLDLDPGYFQPQQDSIAGRALSFLVLLNGASALIMLAAFAFGYQSTEPKLVAAMLADSATELFGARAMLYEVARSIDAGDDRKTLHARASMIKLSCSETAGRVADRAVQVFGGRGYMRENAVERHWRELRVDRIWEGTSEIQRSVVGNELRKRGPGAYAGWPVT